LCEGFIRGGGGRCYAAALFALEQGYSFDFIDIGSYQAQRKNHLIPRILNTHPAGNKSTVFLKKALPAGNAALQRRLLHMCRFICQSLFLRNYFIFPFLYKMTGRPQSAARGLAFCQDLAATSCAQG
jgi:hypothetical protein